MADNSLSDFSDISLPADFLYWSAVIASYTLPYSLR